MKNYFRGCLPFAKKFNHHVYFAYDIVENISLVNGWLTSCLLFVNYLYESQQAVYKDIILADDVLQRYYLVDNVNKLYECLQR